MFHKVMWYVWWTLSRGKDWADQAYISDNLVKRQGITSLTFRNWLLATGCIDIKYLLKLCKNEGYFQVAKLHLYRRVSDCPCKNA